MNQRILEYLRTQRTCVLAVEMLDGSPHAATVHFAHSEDPFLFYFETNKAYRKAEPLLKNGKARASLVIGSTESDMKTLQLDGIIELLKDKDQEIYDTIYLGKFSEKIEKSKDPNFIRLRFTPAWWRFTDWTTPQGKMILTSEDK